LNSQILSKSSRLAASGSDLAIESKRDLDAPSSTPISEWIQSIKGGDSLAQIQLWERYYHQLVALAYQRLGPATGRQGFDEEDILQSVFLSLFQQAEKGKFPELSDRRGLWRLLIVMTERRLSSKLRDFNTIKRGGKITHQPIHRLPNSVTSQISSAAHCPTPTDGMTQEFVSTVKEVLGQCDEKAREIATLRIEGYEISEIAKKVGLSRSTVNRKIRYLKDRLQSAIQDT